MSQTRTYQVPKGNLPRLQKEINRLNKRAARVGAPTVEVVLGAESVKETDDGSIVVVEVAVAGETPKFAGWSFLATIQPLGDSHLVKAVPGKEIDPLWRNADPFHCDHCQTSRYRKETFLVQHDDGMVKQVGRQCMQDFLGGKSPAWIAACAEWFRLPELLGEAEEAGWGGRAVFGYDLVSFLAVVVAVIGELGWVSRSKADDCTRLATADVALMVLNPTDKATATVEARHEDEAATVAEWAKELDESSDYLRNLKVIANHGVVTHKEAGFAASMVVAFRKARETELREKTVRATSHHVGEVGKRGTFEGCKCMFETAIDGFYGTTYLMKFEDGDGNQITTFASNPCIVKHRDFGERPVIGETYTLVGTVKEHALYKGAAQTQLTRVRINMSCTLKGKKFAPCGHADCANLS